MANFLDLTSIDFDDFGGFIGGGTYAATFSSIIDEDRIYRVASKNNRSIAIQKFLANKELGPCFPKLYDSWDVSFNKLPLRVQQKLKNDRTTPNWQITLSELGNLGDLTTKQMPDDPVLQNQILFMLFWSLWTANSLYGFMHRDIKMHNIVLKYTDEPTTMRFKLDNTTEWEFETHYIPLFIDFDFASLLNTRTEKKYMQGTYITSPPEALSYAVLMSRQRLNIYGNGYSVPEGFDVWSLAMTMLSNLGPSKVHVLAIPGVEFEWIKGALLHHECVTENTSKDSFKKFVYLVLISIFQSAIGNGIKPPADLIGTKYSEFVYNFRFYKVVEDTIRKQPKYIKTYSNFWWKVPSSQRKVFKRLLSWDSKKRTLGGKLYTMFNYIKPLNKGREYEQNVKKAKTGLTYTADSKPLFSFSRNEAFREKQMKELNNQQYIASNICNGCGINDDITKSICVCCSKIYCNLKCHNLKK